MTTVTAVDSAGTAGSAGSARVSQQQPRPAMAFVHKGGAVRSRRDILRRPSTSPAFQRHASSHASLPSPSRSRATFPSPFPSAFPSSSASASALPALAPLASSSQHLRGHTAATDPGIWPERTGGGGGPDTASVVEAQYRRRCDDWLRAPSFRYRGGHKSTRGSHKKLATTGARPAVGMYEPRASMAAEAGPSAAYIFRSEQPRFAKPYSALTRSIGPGSYKTAAARVGTGHIGPMADVGRDVASKKDGSYPFLALQRRNPFETPDRRESSLCEKNGCGAPALLGGVCNLHGGAAGRDAEMQRVCQCPSSLAYLSRLQDARNLKKSELARKRRMAKGNG